VFLRLLLLFTLIPLVELVILIQVARYTSLPFTFGLVIATGVLGAALARHEGLRCLQEIQRRAGRGEMPTDALLEGLMILIAGVVLITPGILTDLTGFALLVPPIRRVFRRWLARRIRARIMFPPPGPWPPPPDQPEHDRIIDVKVIDDENRESQ